MAPQPLLKHDGAWAFCHMFWSSNLWQGLVRLGPSAILCRGGQSLEQVIIMITRTKSQAVKEFKRMVAWIGIAAILMVAGALTYLASQGQLYLHMVIATILGVFFSTLLGCGLFALAFFSDKSGHDATVSDSTRGDDQG